MGDIGGAAQAGASVLDTAATNATNIMMQQRANAFNAQQASIGRSFAASQQSSAQRFAQQEQLQAEAYNTSMSNTQMQRRVADLRAAGLNPGLAYSQGGASAPTMSAPASPAIGGPSASAAGLPNIQPMLAGLQGWLTQNKQREVMDAQIANVNVDTQRRTAELPYAGAQAAETVNQLRAQQNQLMSSAMELSAKYNVDKADASKILQDVDFQRQLFPLVQQAKQLDIQAQKYGLPQLATQAQYWSSPLAFPIYAGGQGHAAGGDIGGAAATAAAEYYLHNMFPRRSAMGVAIANPQPGFSSSPGVLESSGIGAPTP